MVSKLASLLHDLHRRRVFRATGLYLVASWVVIEVSTTLFPVLGLPDWSERLVVAMLAVGFPVAVAVAWAFDLGPGGFERTPAVAVMVDEAPGTATPPPARSIAILPFVDLSQERDREYLGDGIADEILNVLAHAPGLQVAARTSSFAYKGRSLDVREIGRQLGVAAVLEGSVRAAGDQLRVTAQLVDVSDGYQRWSRRFDRTLADVFEVQDQIAAEIAAALDLDAPSPTVCFTGTESTEAYEYYLRGRQYFHLKTLRSWRFAEQMFRRALQADPRYAAALAGHADTCSFLYMYYDGAERMLRCADESSLRALEYGPGVPEAHVSRGLALSLRKRDAEAMREFDIALTLNPRSYDARYFQARTSFARGELEAAASYFRMAAELQPDSYEAWGLLATVLKGLGRSEEVLDAQRRTADAAARVLAAKPDEVRALYFGAGALLQLGERERAFEWAERALATDPDDAGVHYNVACFFMQAGEEGRALEHIERAVEVGFSHAAWMCNDPDLHGLRQHPRFIAAVARAAQPAVEAGSPPAA